MIFAGDFAQLPPAIGHSSTGNPWVYFLIPLPIPMNTVPAWVGVQCLSWVSTGYHGYSWVLTQLSILIIYSILH